MKAFKIGFKTALIFLMTIAIFSCSKDDDMEENLEEESVVIDTTIITINGSSFGTDTSKVQVFFDDKEAKIQSVSDTQIKALIPEKMQTGKVKILINNTKLLSTEFTINNTYTLIIPFAGSTHGFADGQGDNAQFYHPFGVAVEFPNTNTMRLAYVDQLSYTEFNRIG